MVILFFILVPEMTITELESGEVSGVVHTGVESLQGGLGDVWTCRIILASAYVLHCLSATWSRFQRIGRSLR